MSYKYDPITRMLVKTRDVNWNDVYKEFDKIVNKYFPNERKIEAEVKALYMKHKGNPAWDEAYRRWMDSPAFDSRTIDASSSDVSKAFASLDKDVQKELKRYAADIQKVDTLKKCKELDGILEDLTYDYMNEYTEIFNQASRYAEKMRVQTQQSFGELRNKVYKKSIELEKAGK